MFSLLNLLHKYHQQLLDHLKQDQIEIYDVCSFFLPILLISYLRKHYITLKTEEIQYIEEINQLIQKNQPILSTSSSEKLKLLNCLPTEYNHQVAGHTTEVIRKLNCKIFKPMLKPKLFHKEITVYQEMTELGYHSTQIAKAFVPKFYGLTSLDAVKGSIPHIILKDLSLQYDCPSIIDIKMGTQTFEPTATEQKKVKEFHKYPYQQDIGFRITGFKVYDLSKNIYYSVTKSFGRSLLPNEVVDGLKIFFHNGFTFQRNVLLLVIERLENILTWLRSQTLNHFYCSSLLIIYDGFNDLESYPVFRQSPSAAAAITAASATATTAATQQHRSPLQCYEEVTKKIPVIPTPSIQSYTRQRHVINCSLENSVQVRMIDFAHTVPSTQTYEDHKRVVDHGYIKGITNLIQYLHEIVDDIDQKKPYHGIPEQMKEKFVNAMSISSVDNFAIS